MDFITGLPRLDRYDAILMVVDCFTKYAHFLGLRHPYTSETVVEVFAKEIVCIHDRSNSFVSDHDPIFFKSFFVRTVLFARHPALDEHCLSPRN